MKIGNLSREYIALNKNFDSKKNITHDYSLSLQKN